MTSEKLELRLADADAPSLASMRNQRVCDIFQVLRRGEIQSDSEWQLLNGVVTNVDERVLDPASAELARTLLAEYERSERPA